MATSGSYNFSTNRDTLITDALLYIGAIGEGDTPTASATTEAARMLNMLMKSWAADGMPLWSLKRGYVLPFTGASSIATTSHVVVDYVTTTFTVAAVITDVALTINSSNDMTAGDVVGIELDDGTVQWSTIVTVDSSTQITVTDPLEAGAAIDNRIYTYTASTDRIQRPLRIFDSQIVNVATNTGYPIDQIGRTEFFDLSDGDSASTPNQFYYDPELANGTFHVFPRFADGAAVIAFSYHRPFQDFDAASDEPDCPQEFYLALVVGLAATLGPKYGVDRDIRKSLIAEAELYKQKALETIYPEGSIYFQPDSRGME